MTTEKKAHAASGWLMLCVMVLAYIWSIYVFVTAAMGVDSYDEMGLDAPGSLVAMMVTSVVVFIAATFLSKGFFSLQPGQARICVLFGKYVGTVRDDGLRWANPLYARSLGRSSDALNDGSSAGARSLGGRKHGSIISTRARTLNGDRLKVNDKMGNPIEIATVVVWHVEDTAKAVFDVDDYESFVSMQTETALRHVASVYAYDHMEDDEADSSSITLRSNIEEVGETLKAELDRRLAPAGVTVDDARLTHLAYAPEIAQAMLRRQQAEAVIAARKKIVEGAVSMVDMALTQLSDDGVVEFDEDRKAVMASNLMVVLCGESDAQPVLNAGSLYQ